MFLQLSDYDSSYSQQRADVGSYNNTQGKQQQAYAGNSSSSSAVAAYDGYDSAYGEAGDSGYEGGGGYGYTSGAGMHMVHCASAIA
jgi:hypothetical protein